ncbi:site-specific integrase [Pseudomonas cremoricolorata]|uniref:Recombinase n=1 Tax=Pseudomonas cremoricolorata TaxID=157783 RepID=A0A089WWK9_9PSED|nr:site-specific integrase [Pseudomonas cremoricolorata]AIR91002.1 recombinase [Pseudomonas cremoricolorata]
MTDIERYVRAATRDNTRRSYQAAVEHFEVHWGGFLPATADSIARYLVEHADVHAVSTLRQRLAALGQWHLSQGFPDPTKAPLVRQVLRGIRTLHPAQARQATPLLLQHVRTAVQCFETEAQQAEAAHDLPALLRARRDRALLLLGFWRGFRGDELARLQVEHIQAEAGVGISLYLPRSKGDREGLGVQHRTPALKALCPVNAYLQWIEVAGLARGPVFRKLDRWGNLSDAALNSNSLIGLLRRMLERAQLPAALYTGHSLRRGFATWATANGWELKALMSYVGWKDAKSALRYIDAAQRFGELAVPAPTPLLPGKD